MASQDASPKPCPVRREFNQHLDQLEQEIGPGRYHALECIKRISGRLERDGVGLTPEHSQTLKSGLGQRQCLPMIYFAEHTHVMNSEGQGWMYGLARFSHAMFEGISKPDKRKW